jgi:hypothetical protein
MTEGDKVMTRETDFAKKKVLKDEKEMSDCYITKEQAKNPHGYSAHNNEVKGESNEQAIQEIYIHYTGNRNRRCGMDKRPVSGRKWTERVCGYFG